MTKEKVTQLHSLLLELFAENQDEFERVLSEQNSIHNQEKLDRLSKLCALSEAIGVVIKNLGG